MTTQTLGSVILWLIVIAVLTVIAVYLLRWLYRRSTKETAFVRTGFGGEKVIINGGAFVVPVLHEMTMVNMNTMRVEVRRGQSNALITRDRMRVDLIAEFFLRVKPTEEAVSIAAQTLGRRAMSQDGIRELFEGKFASALRAVAAEMTLQEIHERRNEFMSRVREQSREALAYNGLELEHVSLVDLDQTSLEFFDPSNAFDAEGLTQLTETIEMRRKMRNLIEQQTMIEIRNQNLDSERRVLEIERESEYARIEQEREIEIRRAMQRAELARERAQRDHEAQQAMLAATEATEKTRIAQERAIMESRIASEEETQRREIARRRAIEAAELKSREETEREQIALELAIERQRISRQQEQEQLEVMRRKAVELAEREREIALSRKAVEVIEADIEAKRAEIVSRSEVERERLASERKVDETRIERERALQLLEIARRQAFEEAEIASGEEVERARITTERGLSEARLVRDRELRRLAIERDKALELAEIEKAIAVAAKTKDRSAAIAEAEAARAQAIIAEEQAMTAREREIAERRKAVELIAAQRESEREHLRLTAKAQAEKEAAASFAEAQQIAAEGEAKAVRIRAEASAVRYKVDADGQRQANEAENLLTLEARGSRARMKLLDKIEGIIRESVRPMEKIEGIKILHVDGITGGNGNGTGGRNVTDEVIDSALRYRVQAPMIDNLMKEVGIEGGSLGRMTDVLRDAKDLDSIVRGRKKDKPAKPAAPTPANGGELAARDRDDDDD
ncbi:flotillin family protein [Rhodoligotrophos defluvii]|uniref:flotillin family protein n=1 Tax=Rhodoligotrophos defluvii TaxID=2561934 RepID=UPI0010C991BB|nr:flotillin family protein [Rhodoligotrophos defluvii]